MHQLDYFSLTIPSKVGDSLNPLCQVLKLEFRVMTYPPNFSSWYPEKPNLELQIEGLQCLFSPTVLCVLIIWMIAKKEKINYGKFGAAEMI